MTLRWCQAFPLGWELNNALQTDYLYLLLHKKTQKTNKTNLKHTYLLWDAADTCDGLSISKGCEYIVSGPVTPPAWMSDNLRYYCRSPPAIYQNTAQRQ